MFTLEDQEVAIIGDVHQDTEWTIATIRKIKAAHPNIKRYIQVGDFGLGVGHFGAKFLRKINKALGDVEMFVILGNHDDYDKYAKALPSDKYSGTRVLREAPQIYFFERQAWFNYGDKRVLTVAGANSINKDFLRHKRERVGGMLMVKDWWEEEQITEEDVAKAISGGKVDVLLSHDTPTQGFPLQEEDVWRGLELFGPKAISYCGESGRQLQRITDAVRPSLNIHGHYHMRTTIEVESFSKKTVHEGLGKDGDLEGNCVILTQDLEVLPLVLKK